MSPLLFLLACAPKPDAVSGDDTGHTDTTSTEETSTPADTDTTHTRDTAVDTALPDCVDYTWGSGDPGDSSDALLTLVDREARGALIRGPTDEESPTAAAFVGDIDGDGLDDFTVGDYRLETGSESTGAALLFTRAPGGELSYDSAEARIVGLQGESTSSAVSGGDLNDDGYGELLFSSQQRLSVLFGPLEGDHCVDEAPLRIHTDGYGLRSYAGLGDLDGDGQADLLLTAEDYSTYASGTAESAAYLFSGVQTGVLTVKDDADVVLIPPGFSNYYNFGNPKAADMTGDGLTNTLLSLPGQTYDYTDLPGAVFVLDAVDLTGVVTLAGLANTYQDTSSTYGFGATSYDIAGDLNGDGYQDLVIGAPGSSDGGYLPGAALIFYGPSDGLRQFTTADVQITGPYLGWEVAGGGDLNEDGHDDLLIRDGDNIHLFPGPILASSTFEDVDTFDERLKGSLSTRGDVDGDGRPDLLLTVPDYPVDGGVSDVTLLLYDW